MCGRFVRISSTEVIVAETGVTEVTVSGLAPRYNVCPGEEIAAVVAHGAGRRLGGIRWGLGARRQINARSESMLRESLGRCLIPADGFYEWQRRDGGAVPHFFRPVSRRLLTFAGIWSRDDAGGPAGAALLTCAANATVAPVHDRMPVILDPRDWARWLDRAFDDPTVLAAMLRPLPADALERYPVSTFVNSAKHDSPQCIRRADTPLRLVDPPP